MKHYLSALVTLFLFLGLAPNVKADYDDAPPEIFVIELIDQPEIEAPKFTPTPQVYEWESKVIDSLAEIFWAETGKGMRADTEKFLITQLIFNRLRYGAPFADTLYGIMEQKHEFNHGKISDKNREKARDYLNLCQSQQDGYFQGLALPNSAIYMGRNVYGELQFYDENWNIVYKVDK